MIVVTWFKHTEQLVFSIKVDINQLLILLK